MITQAILDELENEADLIFGETLREFEQTWNARPSTEAPLQLDPGTLALLMEMEDDESGDLAE